MSDFTLDSINQILLILLDGQTQNKTFEEIISNPAETIELTISTLSKKNHLPKRIKYVSASIILSLTTILSILYFTNWRPIYLGNTNINYDVNSGYIFWESIPNAKEYKVVIDNNDPIVTKNTSLFIAEYVTYSNFILKFHQLNQEGLKQINLQLVTIILQKQLMMA